MYKPWIFAEITGRENVDKRGIVRGQLEKTLKVYGEKFALVYMRKMIGFYLKGTPNAAEIRAKLFKCQSITEVEEILNTLSF